VGRRVDVDALVGAPDIAERLGVAHTETVHNWIRRYADFPQPVAIVSGVRVWNWPDVRAWAKRTGRLK
jgi:predicted DNA-binding transcriptional regulator AlpA